MTKLDTKSLADDLRAGKLTDAGVTVEKEVAKPVAVKGGS